MYQSKTRILLIASATALGSALPSPGPAQGLARPQTRAIVKTLPQRIPVAKRLEPTRVFELARIPEAWIKFAAPAGWATVRRPARSGNGIQPELAGVYAQSVKVTTGNDMCGYGPHAVVDIGIARSHGFSFARRETDEMTPPTGYRFYLPWRPDPPTAAAVLIELGGTSYDRSLGKLRQCWSAFHGHIFLRGPVDVDPVTGARITPSRPPH